MYIDSQMEVEEFPQELTSREQKIESIETPALPDPHPAEQDTYARHVGIPGHQQEALERARIMMVGAGGLNCWTTLGLARAGVRNITIVDPDLIERTNMARQLFYQNDIGEYKATRLMNNIAPHAVNGAHITGIPMRFEEAAEQIVLPADVLVIGVDRNDCRLYGVKLARSRRIPAIFTMLSRDGMRVQIFMQGPSIDDACLWCALPNLDPEKAMPCASSIITSCYLASAYTIFFVHRALMGWHLTDQKFNWREADLQGIAPERTGYIKKNTNCKVCGKINLNLME